LPIWNTVLWPVAIYPLHTGVVSKQLYAASNNARW